MERENILNRFSKKKVDEYRQTLAKRRLVLDGIDQPAVDGSSCAAGGATNGMGSTVETSESA